MKQLLYKLATEDCGQDLIEYALVAALIGLGAIAAMRTVSTDVKNVFNTIGTSLSNA